jgi:hypothetical protein
MTQPDLNPCNEPGPIKDLNIDEPPLYCREQISDCDNQIIKESQKDVTGVNLSWFEQSTLKKTGIGQSALGDPMQSGHIINEQGLSPPNRNTVYRYSKSIRGCDEGMKDMFSDIVVIDEQGKAHNVPIIWGTQEAAVVAVLQENVRKDNTMVVDRIKLPIMSIHSSNIQFTQKRYVYHKAVDYLRDFKNDFRPGFTTKERYEKDTVFGVARGIPVDVTYNLYAWTMHNEDMNQIVEQIMTKFSPMAYIRVRGVSFEIGVRLDSVANNIDMEPENTQRVFKYLFTITAETFISQPIVRKKSVLKTSTEIVDSVDNEDIREVLSRIEETVKELEG